MHAGDIVVEINGAKVSTSEDIYNAVNSGNDLIMLVQRGDELLQLRMTPESAE